MCPARVGPKSNTSPQGCFIRIKLRAHYLFKAEIEENYVIGISSTCSYSVQTVRLYPILMSILLDHFKELTECIKEVERIEAKVGDRLDSPMRIRTTRTTSKNKNLKEEEVKEIPTATLDGFFMR